MKKWTLVAIVLGLIIGYTWWFVGTVTGSEYNAIFGLLLIVLFQVYKTQFDIQSLKETIREEESK